MEARELGHFEVEWPELERWLRSVLTRRGVRGAVVDDLLQETAIRLYRMWDRIDERSPRALAWTIALNVSIDHHKKESRAQITHDIPDRASDLDVEAAGIARIELARVRRALEELTPHQRAVLLADVGDGEDPEASAAATKMLRMRARRKLRLVLDGSKAGAFVFAMKRAVFKLNRIMRTNVPVLEVPVGAVAGICAATIAITVPGITINAPRAAAAGLGGNAATILAGIDALPDRSGDVAALLTSRSSTSGDVGKTANGSNGAAADETRVEIPEGTPVQGHAHLRSSDDDDRIDLPACGLDQPEPDKLTVWCTVDSGSKETTVEGSVEPQDVDPGDILP